MAEYIDREETYNVLTEYYHHSTQFQHDALREALSRVPSADVAPVVHGRWDVIDPYNCLHGCTNCGWLNLYFKFNYCPNCGARMGGE